MTYVQSLIRLLAVGLCALVAACTPETGKVFDVSSDKAKRMLRSSDLPPVVFGRHARDFRVITRDNQVIWILEARGDELMRFVADLTPVTANSTRIRVSLVGATRGPHSAVAQRIEKHPEVAKLYIVAMREQIEATLEDRPFILAKVYPAMRTAMTKNSAALHESAMRTIEADRKRAEDNIARAYGR
jgi:hypothetical protein